MMQRSSILGQGALASVLAGLLLLGSVLVPSAQAVETPDEFILADASPLSDEAMSSMRAGFIDPSGVLLRFAVDVHTMVDGSVTFVRSFVLEPDQYGQMQVSNNAQIMAQNLPAGMNANLIDNGKGLVITDGNGQTTVLNQTAQGAFANIILNTASNRDIAQNINVDIVLRNMQSSILTAVSAGAHAGVSALTLAGRTHAAGL